MGRAPCCDKANVKKGPWSPEEDAKLKAYIQTHGTGGNWIALPQKIGLKRCGKSCRLRWLNYLRPNLKHGGFSEEEDNIICGLYISIGSRWSIIAGQLPGRTDNDIKNYWNTRLKKKLLGKQRREQQAHHQQSRRAAAAASSLVKQEIERSESSISRANFVSLPAAAGGFVNQNPYYNWPELPVGVVPVVNVNPTHHHHHHHHPQLGARFTETATTTTNTNVLYPIDNISSSTSPSPDQFYDPNAIDHHHMLTCISSSAPNNNYAQFPTMFHGLEDDQLSELVYGNSPLQQQLDVLAGGFYGSTGTSATSVESEISWGDINSLVYTTTTTTPTPVISEYETCQQAHSAFAESAYFGLK